MGGWWMVYGLLPDVLGPLPPCENGAAVTYWTHQPGLLNWVACRCSRFSAQGRPNTFFFSLCISAWLPFLLLFESISMQRKTWVPNLWSTGGDTRCSQLQSAKQQKRGRCVLVFGSRFTPCFFVFLFINKKSAKILTSKQCVHNWGMTITETAAVTDDCWP